MSRKSKDKRKKKQDAREPKVEGGKSAGPAVPWKRLLASLEWPGLFGWLGTIFGVAGLWFVVSAFLLSAVASRMRDDDPATLAEADGARRLGFGERYVEHLLQKSTAKGPLRPGSVRRARMAVEAHARSAAVFGVFAFVLAAFLWGFRLRDPAMSAMLAGRDAADDLDT